MQKTFFTEKRFKWNAQINITSEKTTKMKDECSRVDDFFLKRRSSGVFICLKRVYKYPEHLRLPKNALAETTDLFPTKIYKNYSGNLFGIADTPLINGNEIHCSSKN